MGNALDNYLIDPCLYPLYSNVTMVEVPSRGGGHIKRKEARTQMGQAWDLPLDSTS